VVRKQGYPKSRRLVRVAGVSPPVQLNGFENNINTLERAVKERVFFVKTENGFEEPPRPRWGMFAGRMEATRRQLIKSLPRTVPLTERQFVDTIRGRKVPIYEAAYTSLLEKGVSVKDSHIKVFTKYEKVNFTDKVDPVPRVVSPRSPRYNISVGCFFKPIEERILGTSLSSLFEDSVVVFKGMNALESGKAMYDNWSSFRDPVAVGLDAKRFDQHVSVQALKWEHSIYLQCFSKRHKRRFAKLLRWQLRNFCKGYTLDGKLEYEVEGGRMSGDMNTSLGNCVLMCSMIHAYALAIGVRVRLANNGDDCVVMMERRDLDDFLRQLEAWFLSMGFDMAVEPPVYVFEEISFCQTHPVSIGDGQYIMVRDPRLGIAKDTLCIHNYTTDDEVRGWLHAVGTGGLAMTGGVPVFQSFYQSYLRAGKYWKHASDSQSWGVRQLSLRMGRVATHILPETRASFYWAYGLLPDEQEAIENFYDSMDISSTFCDEEVWFRPTMPG
jgi:hypothetical protein